MSRYWDKSEQRYAELESRLRKVEEALRKMAEHLREGMQETGGSYDEPPQPADAWSDRAATLLNFYGDILCDTAPTHPRPGVPSLLEQAWATLERSLSEVVRLTAPAEEEKPRSTCRHGVQWPDICRFNCVVSRPEEEQP
jgi:hypothetical protein